MMTDSTSKKLELYKFVSLVKHSTDYGQDNSVLKHEDSAAFEGVKGAFAHSFCLFQYHKSQQPLNKLGGVRMYAECVCDDDHIDCQLSKCNHAHTDHHLKQGDSILIPLPMYHESINPEECSIMVTFASFWIWSDTDNSTERTGRSGKVAQPIRTFTKAEFLQS
jgi:hypothetical protein